MSLHNPISHLRAYYVQKVLPAVYDDSLSYYEILCKVQETLNEVVSTTNEQSVVVLEMQQAINDFIHGGYTDTFEEYLDEWFEENSDAFVQRLIDEGVIPEVANIQNDLEIVHSDIADLVASDTSIRNDMDASDTAIINDMTAADLALTNTKVPYPLAEDAPSYGTSGQVLATNADGTTEWQDPVVPSDAQAEQVITQWLNAHPEATTTVQDGAITAAKLANSAVTATKLADGSVTDAKLAQSGGVLEKVDELNDALSAEATLRINSIIGAEYHFSTGVIQPNRTSVIDNIFIPKGAAGKIAVSNLQGEGSGSFIFNVNASDGTNSQRLAKVTGENTFTFVAERDTTTIRIFCYPEAIAGSFDAAISYQDIAGIHDLKDFSDAIDNYCFEFIYNLFNKNDVVTSKYIIGSVGSAVSVGDNASFAYIRIPCNPSTTYTIPGYDYYLYEVNDNDIVTFRYGDGTQHSNVTITTHAGTTALYIDYKPRVNPTDTYMMVEGDSYPSEYVPYGNPVVLENALQDTLDKRYGTATILDGAVTTSKLANGAVTDAKLAQSGGVLEEVNNLKNSLASVYHVGSTREYTSLMALCEELSEDDAEKIIYMDAGVYDIFDEIGGSEFALAIEAGTNWKDVSTFIPPNTKIIGLGHVVLQFTPTAEQIGNIANDLLSPINVKGNFVMENIIIKADNCRYGIHDDCTNVGSFGDYAQHTSRYKNVMVYKYSSSGKPQALGGGCIGKSTFVFENCLFQSTSLPFSYHNNTGLDDGTNCPSFYFENCTFVNTGSSAYALRFGNVNWRQEDITVLLSNCYLNKKIYLFKEASGNARQAFDLTLVNCSNVDIEEDTMTANIYTPVVYRN